MEELMAQLQPIVINTCATVITVICSLIGLKMKQIYNEQANTTTKKQVVETTCKYINQVYKDLNGDEKFEKAKGEIVAQLNDKGIKATDNELNVLIEAAVHGIKEGISSK